MVRKKVFTLYHAVRLVAVLMVLSALSSCALKKNTGMTRFWHSLNTRYNIYYNGAQAYIEGSIEKEQGNKDNYTERIPLYTVGNKASRELGKGNYDIAITKAEKAIQLHSIRTKPEWTKNRRKTEKDIEWLSRKEYNPFLWRAWMLMGRSQFYKGEFDEAAATFSYMSRLYKGQPAIYGKARAWLAKCYIESDWIYDAEDVMRSQMRDSIDWRAQKEWDYTLCDYYLHTENLAEASKYLRRVIRHEMRRRQKAREYFLLGQIEAAQGNRREAYEAFRHVPRLNPPYELAFNARIAMTEVLAQGQAKKMIGRLRRMARDDNNKDYLDQVYYAMGNIYLAEGDTAAAIGAYEKGNEKATRTGVEKGVLLLHLGDLYWQLEKYSDAKRCYDDAIGMLDKDRLDYEQLSKRSKILDELVPYTDNIHLQDSLLALSVMPDRERIAAIDRVIKALRDKEKEEEAKQAEAEVEKRRQQYGNKDMEAQAAQQPAVRPVGQNAQNGAWYFYNRQAVAQGKQAFQRLWGRRENVDDWQRSNRTVVGIVDETDGGQDNLGDLAAMDSQATDDGRQQGTQQNDSLTQDPYSRAYYLAQIPFTDEQKAECHEIIKESLLKSAIIFKDKLDNLALSEKQFRRLRHDYTDYEPKDEVYYHLFLLHSRKADHDEAATYIDSLKLYCPDSKYTILLTDPYFAENAKFGKHIEDSLYAATYEAFKADRFQEVYGNVAVSEQRFPLGENRDRFIFFQGMTKLNDGDADGCVEAMELVVKDYPDSPVSELAGMIINGVRAGRRLHGAKFDFSDVWNRRDITLSETAVDSTKTFSDERNTDYLFLMAYAPDSIQENQLLFQMARYNFTSFMVRNFDLEIDDLYGMHHMIVSGFRNFDEARAYSHLLLEQEGIRNVMGTARPIVISEENLALIGTRYSYNDYDTFYVNHFAPLPLSRPEGLYDAIGVRKPDPQPIELRTDGEDEQEPRSTAVDYDPITPILPTEEVAPGGAKPREEKSEDVDWEQQEPDQNMNIIEEAPAPQPSAGDEFNVIEEAPAPQSSAGDEFNVIEEAPAPQPSAGDEFNVIEETPAPQPSAGDEFNVIEETPAPQSSTGDEFNVIEETPAPQPSAGDEFNVIEESPAPQPSTGDEFNVIEETPEEKGTDGDVIDISIGTEVVEPIDEDNFDFFDEETPAKDGNDGEEMIEIETEDGKPAARDNDDEYYELEGF